MFSTSPLKHGLGGINLEERTQIEVLPGDVLIQIFHNVNVRDILCCERLSRFFYQFLQENFDAIQPEKLFDTNLLLTLPATEHSKEMTFYARAGHGDHFWEFKLGKEADPILNSERKSELISTSEPNFYFLQNDGKASSWLAISRSKTLCEALEAFSRVISQRYQFAGISLCELKETGDEVNFLEILPLFPALKDVRLCECACKIRNLVAALSKTKVEALQFIDRRSMSIIPYNWECLFSHPLSLKLRELEITLNTFATWKTFNDEFLHKLIFHQLPACEKLSILVKTYVTGGGIRRLIEILSEDCRPLKELIIYTLDDDRSAYHPRSHVCLPDSYCDTRFDHRRRHEFKKTADDSKFLLEVDFSYAEDRGTTRVQLTNVLS